MQEPESQGDSIRVYVRARPQNATEKAARDPQVCGATVLAMQRRSARSRLSVFVLLHADGFQKCGRGELCTGQPDMNHTTVVAVAQLPRNGGVAWRLGSQHFLALATRACDTAAVAQHCTFLCKVCLSCQVAAADFESIAL